MLHFVDLLFIEILLLIGTFCRGDYLLKKELMQHLRYVHKMRHTKMHSTRGNRGTIRIVNGLTISKRPPEVADRAVPGNW